MTETTVISFSLRRCSVFSTPSQISKNQQKSAKIGAAGSRPKFAKQKTSHAHTHTHRVHRDGTARSETQGCGGPSVLPCVGRTEVGAGRCRAHRREGKGQHHIVFGHVSENKLDFRRTVRRSAAFSDMCPRFGFLSGRVSEVVWPSVRIVGLTRPARRLGGGIRKTTRFSDMFPNNSGFSASCPKLCSDLWVLPPTPPPTRPIKDV